MQAKFITHYVLILAGLTWAQLPNHSPVFEVLTENNCIACHSENGSSGVWLKFEDSTWMVENALSLLEDIKPDSRLGPVRALSPTDMNLVRSFLLAAADTSSLITTSTKNDYQNIFQSFQKGHLKITAINIKGQRKSISFKNWNHLSSVLNSSLFIEFNPKNKSLVITFVSF